MGIDVNHVGETPMGQYLKEKRFACVAALTVCLCLLLSSWFWFKECGSSVFFAAASLTSLVASVFVFVAAEGCVDGERRQTIAFGSLLASFCIVFAVVFPPLSAPDELHHFYATYWVSNMVLGEGNGLDSDPMPMRAADKELCDYMMRSAVEEGRLYEIDRGVYDAASDVASGAIVFPEGIEELEEYKFNLGSENVIAKFGSVAGVVLARVLNLGPLALFYFGRFGSIAFFLACAVGAYRITPVFKNAIVVTSLLPMTLHLAASYSYDSGIIGLSMLLIAFVLRAMYGKDRMCRRDLIPIVVLAAAVAPCKIVYSVSVLLVLFIPADRFSSHRAALFYKAGVFAAAALSIVILRLLSVTELASSASTVQMRGDEVGHFYSIGLLLSQPAMALKLFLRTLDTYGSYYLFTMLGGSLAWLQESLEAPVLLMVAYAAVGAMCMQAGRQDAVRCRGMFRGACAVLFCLCVAGIMLSMCIGHTFDTEPVIRGVQGRYFLPVLPLLLIALRSNGLAVQWRNPGVLLMSSYTVLNVFYVMRFCATALMLP